MVSHTDMLLDHTTGFASKSRPCLSNHSLSRNASNGLSVIPLPSQMPVLYNGLWRHPRSHRQLSLSMGVMLSFSTLCMTHSSPVKKLVVPVSRMVLFLVSVTENEATRPPMLSLDPKIVIESGRSGGYLRVSGTLC